MQLVYAALAVGLYVKPEAENNFKKWIYLIER